MSRSSIVAESTLSPGPRSRLTARFVLAILTLVCHPAFAQRSDTPNPRVATGQAMVVSDSPVASRIGRDVLRDGGNAVDAAVATAFAMAVSWPEAGNLGGGGFMLVLPEPGATPVCVEYRETAPAAATPEMFVHDRDRHALRMVGVPGTVRGLALAHERFGRLPWRRLVTPAAELAADGAPVDAHLADSLNGVLEIEAVRSQERFAELRRVYGRPEGGRWRAGDTLRLPELAATLRLIAESGADAFYRGHIADQLVAEMERGGGLIRLADLADYRAHLRPAIHGTFRGHDVWGPPPPSSGGICLVEMLNMVECLGLRDEPPLSPRNTHRLTEVMRRAYCDRARWLGDPAFTEIPQRLIEKDYARELAQAIDDRRATPSESLAADIPLAAEEESTTHFSVVDRSGMAVANTYTLEGSWGARIVVPGAGFVLNNEMGDFNPVPGRTDRSGLIGTPANLVAPGKRMLSSQTPTIVTRDGRAVLVTGSPGGRTIINTVLGIVVRVLEHEQSLPEAIDGIRLHHAWFPDTLRIERARGAEHAELVRELEARGQRVMLGGKQGSAHSIAILPDGRAQGVADTRRGGAAAAE